VSDGFDVMTMYQTSSSSLVDMYAYGAASTPVLESATPAAAMRLAFDRQRLLEFSLRHHAHLPPTVSAPTSAAAALLNPSDFCLPVVSIQIKGRSIFCLQALVKSSSRKKR